MFTQSHDKRKKFVVVLWLSYAWHKQHSSKPECRMPSKKSETEFVTVVPAVATSRVVTVVI